MKSLQETWDVNGRQVVAAPAFGAITPNPPFWHEPLTRTSDWDRSTSPNRSRWGAKLDRRNVTYTASLFDLKKPLEVTDASNPFVQGGEQQYLGLELTVDGPVTRDLTVVASTMLFDAESSDTGDSTIDGTEPVGVPKFTANLWGDYRIAPF